MLDEEMDDIIKDASDQHYAPYDDQAWSKMENLLDKHLPQKKNRKKFLLFLLLFLLIDAGIAFMIFYPHKGDKTTASSSLETKQSLSDNRTPKIASASRSTTNGADLSAGNKFAITNGQAASSNNNVAINVLTKNKTISQGTENAATVNKIKLRRTTKAKYSSKFSSPDIISDDVATTSTPVNNQSATKQNNDNDVADDQASSSQTDKKQIVADVTSDNRISTTGINKKDTTVLKSVATNNPSSKKENAEKFSDKFAFNLSAGPGISFVGVNNTGKTTISYGAGISYYLGKRFTVRTGFYVSRKIYSAQPSDYHPPKGFWTYYTNLKGIDADCKVYEIPLNVLYYFKPVKKHNWFVSAGLASYLMKKEVYDYSYVNQSGQPQYSTSTINNKNKNLFSVISLSGGYKYNLSGHISLSAEPFIEIPSAGVGFGKINLNSGGILFSAIIRPFAGK